jgi:hypothetical protein
LELDLQGILTDGSDIRDQIDRFLHCKVFGSFEQMRVEMELKYKAQQVFLTTSDKTRLHGYWVPCRASYDE